MTEARAIEGCKKHERIAQKFLYDAYSEVMLMVCLRYVKSLPDAEELMLNGFFNFYKSIDRFVYSGAGNVGAWLKKIVVNECLMFLRKKGALKLVEEKYADEKPVNHDLSDTISAGEILKLIVQLPAGYRTVFNLFVIEGYSHKEISELLQITEGTSKSQLNKARMTLQQVLKQNKVYDGR